MFVETIGLEQYRRVEVGDRIRAQGYTFEVAEIISQNDYQEDGGIYIEFLDRKGNYHYWKEGCDGGYVVEKNNTIVKELKELLKTIEKETYYDDDEIGCLEDEYYKNGIEWCFEVTKEVIDRVIERLEKDKK